MIHPRENDRFKDDLAVIDSNKILAAVSGEIVTIHMRDDLYVCFGHGSLMLTKLSAYKSLLYVGSGWVSADRLFGWEKQVFFPSDDMTYEYVDDIHELIVTPVQTQYKYDTHLGREVMEFALKVWNQE